MSLKVYQISSHDGLGCISASIGCWIKKDVDSALREVLCYLLRSEIMGYQEIYYPEGEIPSMWENILYNLSFHLFGRDDWEWVNKFEHENFVLNKVNLRKDKIGNHYIAIGYFDLSKNINAELNYSREHNYEAPHTVVGFEYEVIEDDGRKYIKLCGGKFMSASSVADIYDKYTDRFDTASEEAEHAEQVDKIDDQATTEDMADEDLYDFNPYITIEDTSANKALPAKCESTKNPDEFRVLVKEE